MDKERSEKLKNLSLALKEINVPDAELVENLQLVAGFSTLRFGSKGFELNLMHSLKKFGEFDFDKCYKNATIGKFDGVQLYVINKKDLIEEKKFVNRPKDRDDVENLERGR